MSQGADILQMRAIEIPRAGIVGDLTAPAAAKGIVLFAHGTGSSRFSSRNRSVARALNDSGLATLLLDLLTPEEDAMDQRSRQFRFDIARLAERLVQATEWIRDNAETAHSPVGYFGASTGAAAALIAAADLPDIVCAVVSRGGRPDLAGPDLLEIKAPTLLIAGERDYPVIKLNETALNQLRCEKRLEIIPDATHLFEEPGALEEVTRLASGWFQRYLPS